MAVSTGTAANYRELLTKIRDFVLTVPGWSQIGGQTGAIAADTDFVSLKGTGYAGEDQIFVSLQPYSSPTSNQYGLQLRGHTSYTAPGTTQTGADSPWTYLPTLNSTVGYWVIANARRFIVIVKTNTRYDAMYAGFILPEHMPADWSYPLYVAASSPVQVAANSDATSHSNFWNACNDVNSGSNTTPSAGYLFSPIQSWVPIRNALGGTTATYTDTGRMTIPWNRTHNQLVRRAIDDSPWVARGQLVGLYRASNGIADSGVPELGTFYGTMDGVFYTPSFGATAEQEATIDGKTYMMVPNVARTSNGHFAAFLME